MRSKIKIVTIGGGSSYTPELMEGFIRRYNEFPIDEIWLVDIKEGKEKLDVITSFAKRMWDASPYSVKIINSLDRRESLYGADFVLTQFRVGQLEARIKDERIPLIHKMLGQETNGAGGIFKALRTIPVIGEIIDDMRELCPEAWLINFTNPSGMITEAAIRKFGWKRTLGLCNVPEISEMKEPNNINCRKEDLIFQFAGLNHFHWHKVSNLYGEDVTEKILTHINEREGGTPVNIYQAPFPDELLASMKLIPCGYHRYYFMESEMLNHSLNEFAKKGTRAEQMKKVEEELFELYKDKNLKTKPNELSKRGGAYYSDMACECICAIYNNKQLRMTVNTENKGAIPCLSPDAIVEISSLISAKGAEPIVWGDMRPAQKGWLQFMKAMEECVEECAITGDYGLLLEAFTMNPLIRSGTEGKRVMDELLVAHEKYLPGFKDKIQELKSNGIECKDEIVKNLIKRGL